MNARLFRRSAAAAVLAALTACGTPAGNPAPPFNFPVNDGGAAGDSVDGAAAATPDVAGGHDAVPAETSPVPDTAVAGDDSVAPVDGGPGDGSPVDTGVADTGVKPDAVVETGPAQDADVADTGPKTDVDAVTDTGSKPDVTGDTVADTGDGGGTAPTVTLPYLQAFSCTGQTLPDWSLPTPPAKGPFWAVDGSPKDPGFLSPDCSLNFNDGVAYECPTAVPLAAAATSPWLDASGVVAGAPLTVRFALNGNWEMGKYDNLDLEASTDDKAWQLLVSYDPTEAGWKEKSVILTNYVGKKFRLRFKFSTTDCEVNDAAGPFIDDLKVYDATCKADGDCDDINPCTTDSCVASKCTAKANTATCNDNNACTDKDVCAAGQCVGSPKTCDDANGCTTDACDPTNGTCSTKNKADGAFCTDANACTSGDACKAGACVTKPATDGGSCDDKNPCTSGESCKAGVCGSGKPSTTACDDLNPCTLDACENNAGVKKCTVKPVAEGAACDDGQTCTSSDACKVGACVGVDKCTTSEFADAFDCDKPNGWVLDALVGKMGWAIDATPTVPAPHSPGCSLNFNDDKGYDNGKQVKGNATSPAITLPAAASVALSFWSYAGVKEATFDKRYVEVLEGTKVLLTKQLSSAADLNKWVKESVDLTPYAGKKVTLRFRFDTGDPVNNEGPGWFVDDVAVGSGAAVVLPQIAKVATVGFAFEPQHVTIGVGGTVEFTIGVSHTATEVTKTTYDAGGSTAKLGGFKVVAGPPKSTPQFALPGVYYYVCEPHAGTGMKGTITVK